MDKGPTVTYQASGESKTYTISTWRKTVTLAQDGWRLR